MTGVSDKFDRHSLEVARGQITTDKGMNILCASAICANRQGVNDMREVRNV